MKIINYYLVQKNDNKSKNKNSQNGSNNVPPPTGLWDNVRSVRESFGLDLCNKINFYT